jgi:hypothetical protein
MARHDDLVFYSRDVKDLRLSRRDIALATL